VPDFSQPILRPLGLDTRFSATGTTRASAAIAGNEEGGYSLTLGIVRLDTVDLVAPQLGQWWRARRGDEINLSEPDEVSSERIHRCFFALPRMLETLDNDNESPWDIRKVQQEILDTEPGSPLCRDQTLFRVWLRDVETSLGRAIDTNEL